MAHFGDSAGGWSFHNPVQIHFGRNSRSRLAASIEGKRCLIVTTKRGRRQLTEDPLLQSVSGGDVAWIDTVSPNPGIAELQEIIEPLRDQRYDAVIGFGGGSAIDSAKVLSVALAEGMERFELRELVREPSLHAQIRPVMLYAVPTTAGTGSEVTPYSTVWDHAQKKKFSLAGPAVYPCIAFVDPALTDATPLEVTLSTGLDAINQAAESVWNRNATPVTIGFATRALKLGFKALPRLIEEGDEASLRNAMAECSLLAGLAISQTRTALCHSISYPVTAHFDVPHGLACAFTMPAVLRENLRREDGRFKSLAEALLGSGAGIDELQEAFEALHVRLKVADRVRAYLGDHGGRVMELTREMYTPERADNSLIPITDAMVRRVIRSSLDAV